MRSEISSRSPDAASVTPRTVAVNALLLSSGNVLPCSCACSSRVTSVNGISMGTATLTRPSSICGTSSNCAGNGQSGLVSVGTIRVSACTPIVSVSADSLMRGCAAKARVGRSSSHRLGTPAAAAPSGIERHILVHSRRAAVSRNGSLRIRDCSAVTCSLTVRSSNGFTASAKLSFMPMSDSEASAIVTCATRLGSNRHPGSRSARAVSITLPLISARCSTVLSVWLWAPCSCPAPAPPRGPG